MSNERKRRTTGRRSRRSRVLRLLLLLLLLGIVAAISLVSGLYVALARNLPELEAQQQVTAAQTTKIFDDAEEPHLLAELHGIENREIVGPDRIPQAVRDAVVAVEDERFYTHQGVDLIGILRALWADLRQGAIVQGGSTITQQFIKNAYISSEKTLDRKVKEAALAYQLEKQWSKDKILNEYLNIIYFGEGAYGIEAAAKTYFGVRAQDLTLAQAALLAGVTKSPARYSPRRDPEASLTRRDLILNKMYQQSYISSVELQQALAEPLVLADKKPEQTNEVPYWVELVREQLTSKYGSQTVLQGGLRVYTSIDLGKQAVAERVIAETLDEAGDPSASLVSIDVRTGRIVAMVGGADFSTQQFNIAVQGHRQPGSAFKTFVLVAALQQGVGPSTTYDSGPITVELPGEDWNVKSPDQGTLTLAEGTAKSSNGLYARLMMDVGPENVVDTAHRMGIETQLAPNPAIALGGLTTGVTPLEMAQAYGTLATGGNRLSGSVVFDPDHPQYPITITRVLGPQGELIDENRLVSTPVVDPRIAYTATEILKGVIDHGTGEAADIGRPAAGKTGTTQQYRDAWFVGYTPDLVTAVWVGYPDEQKEMTDVHGIKVSGGTFPARIWAAYMKEALAGTEPSDFIRPPGAEWVTVRIDPESGLLATEWCPDSVSATFLKGTEPTEPCPLHGPEEVLVPDVVGKTIDAARGVLETARFLVAVTEAPDLTVPEGTVTAQDPLAGTTLLQNSTVTLTVATGGGAPGTVPDVIDLDVREAERRLAAAGYSSAQTQATSEAPDGTVLDQDPDPGAAAPAGTTVSLVVSAGPGTTTTTQPAGITVPDVVGQRLAKALQQLSRAGLEATASATVPSDDPGQAGTIARQSPAAGAVVPLGAMVELTVYANP